VSDPARLELIEVSKRYGETVALDGLSFGVTGGQMFGFVGPNGAGKTTAMRIVLGVLAADTGQVLWEGEPIGPDVRRTIGYMPEERGLYPKMRVREQLAYLAMLHGVPDADALEAAGEWVDRLGLSDRAEDTLESLSLGNQQRVQLAAALVHRPRLLVLDEPFSALDPVGVDLLSEILLEEIHTRGVPVIFSSHQLDLVERLCDAVAIIAAGRLVAAGGVADLRRQRGGRRWRVQTAADANGWDRDLPAGFRRVQDGVFELEDGADPQQLLDAARAHGRVESFGPADVTLAELFREATAA
jgi:ABC-2 type transport system ATP-binding protein